MPRMKIKWERQHDGGQYEGIAPDGSIVQLVLHNASGKFRHQRGWNITIIREGHRSPLGSRTTLAAAKALVIEELSR